MPAAEMSRRKPTTRWYFAENYEEVLADMSNKTNSSFSTTKGKQFEKDECRLLLEIWEAEFQGLSDKVRMTIGKTWSPCTIVRLTDITENEIKKLKDQYELVKYKMKTTG